MRNNGNHEVEEEEDDEEEEDADIQEMKAKFNQILANFDNEQHAHANNQKQLLTMGGQSNGGGSQTTTGYFKGGVPQEL